MNIQDKYFDVYPKIVPSDKSTVITIRDKYNQSFIKDDTEYEVRYYPLERYSHISEYKFQDVKIVKPVNGTLQIEQYFKAEQEHVLEIQQKDNENPAYRKSFRFYSLNEDLFLRKPYKGDLHMHTHYSDGKESPAYVTASCRKIGLDFMAITDHEQYYPSIESQEVFKAAHTDLLICRGEEVHPINNPVHMINFGGSFSVNEMIKENKDQYLEEVKKIEAGLSEIKDEDSKYQCASCTWCFDKIRQGGGLGIFSHPYWQVREGYYISETVTSYLLEKQPYDALEIIGGYYKHEEESNTLQIARYHEERSKGRKVPIVGVSDAHGCETGELFGWFYSIVFAPSLEQQEIIGSIKDLYSVAVEAIPGETIRTYGPFRYVKYASFLIREVMPLHDALCFEEGTAMLEYISGQPTANDRLKSFKGRTESLYNKLWAK